MKKLVQGLVGTVLSCAACLSFSGCQERHEAQKFLYHSNEIRKIIGAEPNDVYKVFSHGNKGYPFQTAVYAKKHTKIIMYYDLSKDGKYFKDIKIFPHGLDVLEGFLSDPNEYKKHKPGDELLEKLEKKLKGLEKKR